MVNPGSPGTLSQVRSAANLYPSQSPSASQISSCRCWMGSSDAADPKSPPYSPLKPAPPQHPTAQDPDCPSPTQGPEVTLSPPSAKLTCHRALSRLSTSKTLWNAPTAPVPWASAPAQALARVTAQHLTSCSVSGSLLGVFCMGSCNDHSEL